jgi:hypothetical protein
MRPKGNTLCKTRPRVSHLLTCTPCNFYILSSDPRYRMLAAYDVGRLLNRCEYLLTRAWIEYETSRFLEEAPRSASELSLAARRLVASAVDKQSIQEDITRSLNFCLEEIYETNHIEAFHVFYNSIYNMEYDLNDAGGFDRQSSERIDELLRSFIEPVLSEISSIRDKLLGRSELDERERLSLLLGVHVDRGIRETSNYSEFIEIGYPRWENGHGPLEINIRGTRSHRGARTGRAGGARWPSPSDPGTRATRPVG